MTTTTTTNPPALIHRWDSLPEDSPMAGISRQRVIGEKMMISRVTLKKGTFVPTHAHANEQFACIMSGRLRFELGNQGDPGDPDRRTVIAAAGEVLHLPSNLPHSALAEVDSVVLDLFSPPSEKTGIDQH